MVSKLSLACRKRPPIAWSVCMFWEQQIPVSTKYVQTCWGLGGLGERRGLLMATEFFGYLKPPYR